VNGIEARPSVVAVGMDDRSLSGERITSTEQPSRRYKPGRVCEEPGCRTKLSIYNDGQFCSLHQPMITPRTRGRKIA
jgi:hypothetical protein